MHYLKYVLFLTSAALVTGCAELSAINTKVGEIAGQINQSIYGSNSSNTTVNHNGVTIHSNNGSFTSRQNIDKLFIKVRREFGFRPVETDDRAGKVYHTVQGTLYHVSGFFGHDEDSRGVSLGDNYLEVILENTGNNTVSISWEASGSERWIKQAESRLTKAVKN
ncbi:TPA: hemophilus-specific protein [Pasteurella multocida]|uniref:hemophilus-specific protein n=1 Tax=Pasteurella multocida TaxID=747 RepID=UPI001093D891|nr:hemophilus-specific protein [Pasteurella multocida]MCU9999554.1 hemophilus-specific protein [[Pasteurella] aerogenes]QCA32127.1 hemophilus-specific protein [Pasteurella multocida]QXG51800.1 hemophilus-specific protein [Pasteurella multocida]UWZ92311.1 hemophilus-specific protein [[Pasteurella] aerogenes]WGE13689.1 hemophilus-specific protein [Pasteurella multocida]